MAMRRWCWQRPESQGIGNCGDKQQAKCSYPGCLGNRHDSGRNAEYEERDQ